MITVFAIERYWRIRNDPYRRNGMAFEDAMIYCDSLEHEMSSLSAREQAIVLCMAAGYTAEEMAPIVGVSWRTVARGIHELRKRDDVFLPTMGRGRAA